jgi:hypothetical protein
MPAFGVVFRRLLAVPATGAQCERSSRHSALYCRSGMEWEMEMVAARLAAFLDAA